MLFFLRFALAAALILFLPGALATRLLLRRTRPDVVETIPYAFGASVVLVTAIAVGSFALRLSLTAGLVALGVMVAALATLAFRARGRTGAGSLRPLRWRQDAVLAVPALLLLAVVVGMGYRIEMPPTLGQEDNYFLMMAQKIAGLPQLRPDHLLPKPGYTPTYIVPAYAYALALLSRVSRLEVVQVYCKMRFLMSLVAITATYALARALFPRVRGLAWFTMLVVCAAVWSGWGTRFSGAVFGQFFPFAQYGDWTLCVMVPVALLFFVTGTRDGWSGAFCAWAVTASALFMHAREVAVLIVLYASLLLGLALAGHGRARRVRRGALVVLAVVGASFCFRAVQARLLDAGLLGFDAAMKGAVDDKLKALLQGPLTRALHPALEQDSQLLIGFNLFYGSPYFLLAGFLIPLFSWWRRVPGLAMLACALAAPIALSAVPVLSLVLVHFSYAQMLFGAPATLGMFPLAYLAVAVFSWWLVGLVGRAAGAAAFALTAAFPLFLPLPQWIYRVAPSAVYLWVWAGSVIALALSFRAGAVPALAWRRQGGGRLLEAAAVAVALSTAWARPDVYGLKVMPEFADTPTTAGIAPRRFLEEYRQAASAPSVSDWDAWYKVSSFGGLPWRVVRLIRERIPKGKVFAVPVRCKDSAHSLSFAVPVLTDEFVHTSGVFHSMLETEFFERLERARSKPSPYVFMSVESNRRAFLQATTPHLLQEDERVQYYMALVYWFDDVMCDEQPIFNRRDPPALTRQLIRWFQIDYVLAPPEWRDLVAAVLRPQETLEVGGWLIARVPDGGPVQPAE